MARGRRSVLDDPARAAYAEGCAAVHRHPVFGPLMDRASNYGDVDGELVSRDGWAAVSPGGRIYVNTRRRAEPDEWVYVIASSLLHLGFGHFRDDRPADSRLWTAACSAVVARFLRDLKFGTPPFSERGRLLIADLPLRDESGWCEAFRRDGVPEAFAEISIAGPAGSPFLSPSKWDRRDTDWPAVLADGVRTAARYAVAYAGGAFDAPGGVTTATRTGRVRERVMSSYPLLGALAAHFTLVEDADVGRRLDIRVAAVSETLEEIYVNPAAALSEDELLFVYAHELLHVGLRHHDRRAGRDPFLWNVACDFAINAWLLEMRVGSPPASGMLHDAELNGLSAENIYDRMTRDMRVYRKLATLAGTSAVDMLERRGRSRRDDGVTDLDEVYRSALARGFELHEEQGRGVLPAGLVEEIRALSQPPIPWDVALAQWFDARFPPLRRYRSYARLSRRQSATPEIPRPHWITFEEDRRTFGVVLDTSGSMDRELLGKALGSIASYGAARDVASVRLVFCDAVAYDEGYVPIEEIAQRVRVRGRGGTVLQPGIDLLEKTPDFPAAGPILVITDGWCDAFSVRRDHAVLTPAYARLPFTPRGPVFRVR
jgi:predicted metal-dependent peptidase